MDKILDDLLQKGHITQSEYEILSQRKDSRLAFRAIWIFCLILLTAGALSFFLLWDIDLNNAFVILGGIGLCLSQYAQSSLNPVGDPFVRSSLTFFGAILGSFIFFPVFKFAGMQAFAFISMLIYFFIMGYIANSAFLVTLSGLQILPLLLFSFSAEPMTAGALSLSYIMLPIGMPVAASAIAIVLAIFFYTLSRHSTGRVSQFLIIYSRVMVISANISLLIASLVGPEDLFRSFPISLIWLVLLIGSLVWAEKNKRRWLVTTSTAFLIIHLYSLLLSNIESGPMLLIFSGFSGLVALKVFMKLASKERYLNSK